MGNEQVHDLHVRAFPNVPRRGSRVLAYRPKDKGARATKMRDQIKKAERKAKREEGE